jgi:hypothetical protein
MTVEILGNDDAVVRIAEAPRRAGELERRRVAVTSGAQGA